MSVSSSAVVKKKAATDHRAALIAAYLGWTLDAFDYFLLVFCLTAIGREFHRSDAEIAFSLTITLALRPAGAFLFGLLADRYGRKWPMMVNLVFYAAAEMGSGLAGSYTAFLLMRALFGIGMGGQWGLGTSLTLEKAPKKHRGLVSGLLQQGYATGNLLAALCFFFLFDRVGWRVLFLMGGLPGLLSLFVYLRVNESEVWRETRHKSWNALGSALLGNWKLFLYLAALMTTMALVAHGTQDMYPTFLERQLGFRPAQRALVTAFTLIGAIIGGAFFGHLSDRFGRRRTILAALLGCLAVTPLWAFAGKAALLVLGGFLMQFFVQAAWGAIPAHLAELSPDGVRGFLPGFAYQCGTLLAGSVAYLEAIFAQRSTYAIAMAETAATVFTLAAIAVWFGPERRGVTFGRSEPIRE